MSTDYQIIDYQDAVPVQKVGLVSDEPATLEIVGSGFVDVVSVLINAERSPEFIVLSSTKLWAQIPSSQLKSLIQSVVVLTARGRYTDHSVLSFVAVPSAGRTAEGRAHLVQTFLRLLLTTPGSDIFNPSAGGGLLSLVGRVGNSGGLLASAKLAVSKAQTQMVAAQSQSSRLSATERLRSATLLSSSFDPSGGTLYIRIRLTAVDGSTTDAGFTV